MEDSQALQSTIIYRRPCETGANPLQRVRGAAGPLARARGAARERAAAREHGAVSRRERVAARVSARC